MCLRILFTHFRKYQAITEKLTSVNEFAISIDKKEGIPRDELLARKVKDFNQLYQEHQDLTSLIDDTLKIKAPIKNKKNSKY